MRLASLFIAGFLAAGALCCRCQAPVSTQEGDRARQLLGSARWVDKAWGAYLAGRLHVDDLDQLLIEQFRQAGSLRDAESYTDEHAFVSVLFDAAIEAGITVPAALLEPFEEHWPHPVLILLARDKDSEDSLLRLGGEKSRDIVWLAANDLLFETKSQPWFTATLGAIRITHRFTVTDPGSGGVGGGHGGGVYGDGVAAMPKGFPPVTLYTLVNSPQKDSVLLARGPVDVYYKRTVVPTDKQVGIGSGVASVDRNEIRIGYLAQLRPLSSKETERLLRGETQIQYTNSQDFEREVERSMNAQERGIRDLILAIAKDGLRASGIHLQIVPEVIDRRQNATTALPVVAPRDIALD